MTPAPPDWLALHAETPAAFLPDGGGAVVNAAWEARGLPTPTAVRAEGTTLKVSVGTGRHAVPGVCVAVPGGRLALAAGCDVVPEALVLHEVRNLATAILAVTEGLGRDPSFGDRRGADLQLAVGQLAAVLGAGSGQGPARCDLVAAVRAAVRLSRGGLAVPVVVDPASPPSGSVGLSAGDVLQILLNLVQNAAAAVQRLPGSDPVIRVRVHAVERGLAVCVEDRGVGLGAGDPEDFFVPGRSGRGSSGIGLAAARGIALAAGGDLSLQAREGGGAVATLRLPRLAWARAAENRRLAPRVAPALRMTAQVSLPGTHFGARVSDWSAGGMRLRGGGVGVPVGTRGLARLRRPSGPAHEVAIEVVRTTERGDPCYRFVPGLPAQPAAWLRQDLSRVGAPA